jgi:hypothetical protein
MCVPIVTYVCVKGPNVNYVDRVVICVDRVV